MQVKHFLLFSLHSFLKFYDFISSDCFIAPNRVFNAILHKIVRVNIHNQLPISGFISIQQLQIFCTCYLSRCRNLLLSLMVVFCLFGRNVHFSNKSLIIQKPSQCTNIPEIYIQGFLSLKNIFNALLLKLNPNMRDNDMCYVSCLSLTYLPNFFFNSTFLIERMSFYSA